MPEQTMQWFKLAITGFTAFVLNLLALAFAGGKYVDRLEKSEKEIESIKKKVAPEDGIPIMMSVPECVKMQAACQKLTETHMRNIERNISNLTKAIETREQKFDKQVSALHTKIDNLKT